MNFQIVRWYDERKTVTHVHSFEDAYKQYINASDCDTVQVYAVNGSTTLLLAQKDC